MTLVLADEPKALVLAAERLLDLSANIRKNFTIDELAFRLADYIKELRATKNLSIGTSGFTVYRTGDEDDEEISIALNISQMHVFTHDPITQQFHHDDGPWRYDNSCPQEWREDA